MTSLRVEPKGYASLDYEFDSYRTSDLVKLDILLAGDVVDALSFIVHKDKAYDLARGLCDRLKGIILSSSLRSLSRRYWQ